VSKFEGVWRSGNLLVVRRGAQLPDHCIKTNQSANGKRFKETLYWHHPAIYILALFQPIIYIFVAMAVRKKVVVYLGVTKKTLQKRKQAILWSWGIGIVGIILFLSSVSLLSVYPEDITSGLLFLLGIVLMIGGLIVGARSRLVGIARLGDEYIWIRGVTNEYLGLTEKVGGWG
jgi:hypothetical protein